MVPSTPRKPTQFTSARDDAHVITTRGKLMVAERYQVGRVALLATFIVDIVPHLCRRGYRVTHSRGIPTTWLSVGGTLHVNHHAENGRSHCCRSVHFKCRPVIVYPAGNEPACGFCKSDSGDFASTFLILRR